MLLVFPSGITIGFSSVYILAAGVMLVVGTFTFFSAFKRIPLSLLMPMVSLHPLVPIGLALLLLNESITVLQGAGAGLALLGVVIVSRK